MSTPHDKWEPVEVEELVKIPTIDGDAVAETVTVKVKGYRNPDDGEVYFDHDTLTRLDKIKARRMGILQPNEIRELREGLGLTQNELSDLLQIGQKTYSRWETARERPSRSMNILLRAVRDGRIDVPYLRAIRTGKFDWRPVVNRVSHFGAWTESLRDCFAETKSEFLGFADVSVLLFNAYQKALEREPESSLHVRYSFRPARLDYSNLPQQTDTREVLDIWRERSAA